MKRTLSIACLAACLLAAPLFAADHLDGYRADFQNDFDRASKKLADLAEAMPEDAFSFRVSDEVRSVSEIYMHVAGTNYYLARSLGVEPPADLPEDLEKEVTAKADVIAAFNASLDHIRQAVEKNEDLDREIELFGGQRSVRGIFMIVAGHAHEHLGQAIAYARAKGVVPPWSRPQE